MKLCNTAPVPSRIRPSAPEPQPYPLRPLALIRTLKRKPLECWAAAHFEQPIVSGGLPIGHALLVHEPQAIRHVLFDNAANYRKDHLQGQVLSAGLNRRRTGAGGARGRCSSWCGWVALLPFHRVKAA